MPQLIFQYFNFFLNAEHVCVYIDSVFNMSDKRTIYQIGVVYILHKWTVS